MTEAHYNYRKNIKRIKDALGLLLNVKPELMSRYLAEEDLIVIIKDINTLLANERKEHKADLATTSKI